MIGDELQGRYQILDQLGSGGMGEVYLAQHVRLDRLEAIKVLKRSMASQWEGRFRREARAMNRLCHPNIIAVYDFGQLEDGRFYLSMEYAAGGSVKQVLELDGRFSTDRALALLLQLAEAIDHAHEKGVIHRDLKPANMILMRKRDSSLEVLKILDFGVAKILWDEADVGAGTGNLILGTPAYMAPELFSGVGDDPRSDIYAVGCIGFELLTARPPFSGRPLEIADQHLGLVAPRPGEVIEDGGELPPKELEDVLAWCLQKNPEDRPQTGEDIAAALRGVLRVLRTQNRGRLGRSTLKNQRLRPVPAGIDDDTVTEAFVRAHTATGAEADLEMAGFEYRLVLKRLGEYVVDAGATDAKLLLTLANVGRADGDLARAGGEIQDLNREQERATQMFRERQSSLRFSIGELEYARMHSSYSGEDAADMLEAIAQLHAQLRGVETEHGNRFAGLQEREIELVARQSNLEETRDRMYRLLDDVIVRVAPEYARGSARVTELMEFIDERRMLLQSVDSASLLPVR